MAEISELIYETCKAYLVQQGKLLLVLLAFIGTVIVVYFLVTGLELSKIRSSCSSASSAWAAATAWPGSEFGSTRWRIPEPHLPRSGARRGRSPRSRFGRA